jgi:myosin heavy subunit
MNSLIKIDPKEFGLTETKAQEVAAMFRPMLEKMVELESEYNALTASIDGEPTEQDCSAAKELRLQYVKVRTGTAAIHKELKAFYLAGGRFVDGWKNAQLMASQGIEDRLKEIETHQERKEAARIAKLESERTWELSQFSNDLPPKLGEMSEDVYQMVLSAVRTAHANKIEAERKAEEERKRQEEERIAREKAEAKERERIRKENERLKREAAEREKAEAEERRRREAEEQKRRKAEAMAEKKRQEEREKVEREYREKLEIERRERLRVQKEIIDRQKAEEEAKRKAEEEAEAARQAELAKDDGQVMADLHNDIRGLINKYNSRFQSEEHLKIWSSIHGNLVMAFDKAESNINH